METAPPLKAEEVAPPFVVISPLIVIVLPALAVNDAPEAVDPLVSIAPPTVMVVFGAERPRAKLPVMELENVSGVLKEPLLVKVAVPVRVTGPV